IAVAEFIGDDHVLLGPQRQHRLITAIAVPRFREGRLRPVWPRACRNGSRWRRHRGLPSSPAGGIADRGRVRHWRWPNPTVAPTRWARLLCLPAIAADPRRGIARGSPAPSAPRQVVA